MNSSALLWRNATFPKTFGCATANQGSIVAYVPVLGITAQLRSAGYLLRLTASSQVIEKTKCTASTLALKHSSTQAELYRNVMLQPTNCFTTYKITGGRYAQLPFITPTDSRFSRFSATQLVSGIP